MVRVILCKALHQAAESGLCKLSDASINMWVGQAYPHASPITMVLTRNINPSPANASAAGRFSAIRGSWVSSWAAASRIIKTRRQHSVSSEMHAS